MSLRAQEMGRFRSSAMLILSACAGLMTVIPSARGEDSKEVSTIRPAVENAAGPIPALEPGKGPGAAQARGARVVEAPDAAAENFVRAVLPVPPVVRQVFDSAGLRAFNPFHVWGPEPGPQGDARDRPAVLSAEESAVLPAGELYDVLPVWEAMGLHPQAGTRVLYHPESGLLFGRIAKADEARLRELCSWPLKIWGGSLDAGGGNTDDAAYQPQLALSAWLIPATGPGDWRFQPWRPEELMALPESARKLAGRQRLTTRSGQRCVVRSYRHAAGDVEHENPAAGLELDVEQSGWEQSSSYQVLSTATLTHRLESNGRTFRLVCPSSRLVFPGDSWLVEAGTLPGEPPQRVFLLYSLPEKPAVRPAGEAPQRLAARWRGEAPEASGLKAESATDLPMAGGRTDFMAGSDPHFFSLLAESQGRRRAAGKAGSAPEAGSGTSAGESQQAVEDPFAQPAYAPSPAPWEDKPKVKIPEWFGDEEVTDISAFVAEAFPPASGTLQAWLWEDHYFLKGDAAALAKIREGLRRFHRLEPATNLSLEARLSLLPPSSSSSSSPESARPGGGLLISRVLLPGSVDSVYDFALEIKDAASAVAAGQVVDWESAADIRLEFRSPPRDAATEESSLYQQSTGPDASEEDGPFQATITLSLSPPLTKAPLRVALQAPVAEAEGSPIEVATLPGLGKLMLSLRMRTSVQAPPAPAPNSSDSEDPLLEFWWAGLAAQSIGDAERKGP